MTQVTLLGTALAEPETEFVYRGEAAGCAECPYRTQCLNLQEGRRYVVREVRDGAQVLDCAVHPDGVQAVEVDPVGFRANVPSKAAYAGSTVRLPGPCPHTECPSHHLCEPNGGTPGEEYQVAAVEGAPPHTECALDRQLTTVEVAAPPEE
ncbi:UNVERIFIED_CONTAM: hypothetical protein BEN50_22450 [Euhalothece sp. KZN 001]|jgi:uncharacterized protein (UPF0179 family)